VPFTMQDIDRLSRRVPVLCKVAPSVADVHMEDVHRAGGIMAILGELDRAGLLNRGLPMVHSKSLEDALSRWDIKQTKSESVRKFFMAAPGNVPTQVAFSQERRFEELDTDRATGCVRDAEHAYSKDGGLAVLSGNLALEGCIVKTAGVDQSILKFEGPARVFESQDAAVEGILGNKIKAGDRRCSIRPATSNRRALEKFAHWSPMVASPAARQACRSDIFRRKPPKAG
jgi:dihydroxy-acid dehydratase